MRYHIRETLSAKQAKTPEGFLVCYGVPIARVGVMEYSSSEVPIDAPDGMTVHIQRDEDEVFASECLASFEGKPVTINHPDHDVTPTTWKSLAVGHAQNVRRGEGIDSGLLLADLVITDQTAIDLVRGGLREISCGYDADYEQDGPGRGRQLNIRGNHIALVRRGRCGPSCRINDNQEDIMKKKASFTDRLLQLLKSPEARKVLDEAEEEKPVEESTKEEPATDEGEDRITAIESKVEELTLAVRQLLDAKAAPAEDEEPDAEDSEEEEPKTKDAANPKARDKRTVDADTKSRAELLYPGIRVVDSDSDCAVKRLALRGAAKDADISSALDAVLRGSTLDSCDCVTLDAAFVTASELARVKRNNKTADGLLKTSPRDFGKGVNPADINAINRDFHKKGGL